MQVQDSRVVKLLAVVVAFQLATAAMVGYLFYKAYRVSSAFGELQKAFVPSETAPAATESKRPLHPATVPASIAETMLTPQSQPDPSLQVEAKPVEVVNVDYKLVESNDSWYRYAWRATIKNNTASAQACRGDIQWLDEGSFALSNDSTGAFNLSPKETATVTGVGLISPASAGARVAGVRAKVSCR